VETIEEAAVRAATQIAMLDREHRAMLADYLRNSDAARSAAEAGLGRELNPIVLVLDNVRSVHNVGSILRTAETAGATEVVTTGITPHPPHPKVDSPRLESHLTHHTQR
jgi:tRNA G18 (ribose-2'-O)-methylase SpoU